MPTFTPNYNWNLPLVNDATDQDQWGGLLNQNISSQDTIVKNIDNATYRIVSPKSANYVALASDRNYVINMDASGAARSVTLPSPTGLNGYVLTVKKSDSSANTVTITGTIDGTANATLLAQYDFITVVSDGTTWSIIGRSFVAINGALVSSAFARFVSNTGITSVIPFDDTIPQITEGTEILSISFTPKSTTNKLRCRFQGMTSYPVGGGTGTVAVFANTGPSAFAASGVTSPNSPVGYPVDITLEEEFTPNAVTAQTISVRAGPEAGTGTMYFNGRNTNRLYGGISSATLTIEEIRA